MPSSYFSTFLATIFPLFLFCEWHYFVPHGPVLAVFYWVPGYNTSDSLLFHNRANIFGSLTSTSISFWAFKNHWFSWQLILSFTSWSQLIFLLMMYNVHCKFSSSSLHSASVLLLTVANSALHRMHFLCFISTLFVV